MYISLRCLLYHIFSVSVRKCNICDEDNCGYMGTWGRVFVLFLYFNNAFRRFKTSSRLSKLEKNGKVGIETLIEKDYVFGTQLILFFEPSDNVD